MRDIPCESGAVISTAEKDFNIASDTFSPCWMLNSACHGKGYAYETAHVF